MGFTGKHGTDLHGLTPGLFQYLNNGLGPLGGTHMICLNYDFSGFRIGDCFSNITPGQTIFQGFYGFPSIHKGFNLHIRNLSALAAVHFTDNQILRYVNQSSGQITGVCSTQSGIGKSLSCTVRRDKILQYVQTFTEVGLNRKFNRMSGGIRHQSAHSGKLLNLLIGTTGTGVRHHKDVVVLIQSGQQIVS